MRPFLFVLFASTPLRVTLATHGGDSMSDIGEGLGTAVEGRLFARVLDPASGAKERHPHGPDKCLNCGTQLVGAYCHACGQNGHIHRTIGAFLHDLLHGALHFEGKMWRTLPLLVLRPGALTRRYIEGARARFVSPMALFLFSVFLMFAVFQVLGINAPTDADTSAQIEEMQASLEDGIAAEIEPPANPDDPAVDPQSSEGEAIPVREDGSTQMTSGPSGNEYLDPFLNNPLGVKWRENPSLMLYKMQANAYKFSWLLIPLSIPFMWLLFVWKRRYRGYDHAIFVTYSLSFMTLLFVTVSVLYAFDVAEALIMTLMAIAPPLHLYKQLRGAYELSRFSAIWRLFALSACIWLILVLFLQILLLLGAF